ncbi:hypothetical protein F5Y03DRAFT_243486 [Xylaria venustula]|nr:hypothetical protein F5Y03DRAFT_243486 [Xylaria venustula]
MLPIRNTRSLLQASSKAAAVSRRPVSALLRAPNTALNRQATPARFPSAAQQIRFVTKKNGFQIGVDPEEEKKNAQHKLTPHPESVSTESSVRHVYEPSPPGTARPVQTGITDELQSVKETFSLSGAPSEPYRLGLAGTIPYLGTSISTVYLAWVLNTPWPAPSQFANSIMISPETASQLMATLEPIQLGYGAVIISFLGAVHWGMEYAEKIPDQARTRFRYGLGVAAPIFAWPTLFIPVEWALTAQFAAFVGLYFADARATVRGWAPTWYSNYRFALTAVVGVAIAISLIGRAKVGDAKPRLTGLDEKFHQRHSEETYDAKWEEREREEIQKVKKQEKEAEEKKKKEEEEKKKQEKQDKGKKSKDDKKDDEGKSSEDKKDKQSDKQESGKDEGKKDDGSNKDEDSKEEGDEKEGDKGESGKEESDKK